MNRNRRTVYLILKAVEKDGAFSNLAINSALSKEGADSPAFVREMVYGILRNQFLLDYNINRFLTKKNINYAERIFLRMGFYQLSFMDSVPQHTAVDETVKLASSFKKGSQGFINAVLRSFIRSGRELCCPAEESPDHLSVKYSCSQDIVDLLVNAYGREKAEEILEAYMHPAKLEVRLNSLKPESSKLNEADISMDSEAFRKGLFHVQGKASQMACELLGAKPGDTVIDMCAAPGGKTCTIAEIMENRGRIYAFDYYEQRAALVSKLAGRLGIDIISAAQGDGTVLNEELIGIADCVIADVPCSGLGVIAKKPELKLKGLSKETKDLPQIQLSILHNASEYVKIQGANLLYSTCTVNPSENRGVIDTFLTLKPDFYIAEEKLLLPGETDGFYMCLLRRRNDQCRIQN